MTAKDLVIVSLCIIGATATALAIQSHHRAADDRPHPAEPNARRWSAEQPLEAHHVSCGVSDLASPGWYLCTFYVGSTVQIFECTPVDVAPTDACREPTGMGGGQ